MSNMIKFPYNARAVARLDEDNIVHNHLYHNCPIGKVDSNIIYDVNDVPVGRVDEDGTIHSHHVDSSPIGSVDSKGYVSNNNNLVARIDSNSIIAGGAYLLLVHNNR